MIARRPPPPLRLQLPLLVDQLVGMGLLSRIAPFDVVALSSRRRRRRCARVSC